MQARAGTGSLWSIGVVVRSAPMATWRAPHSVRWHSAPVRSCEPRPALGPPRRSRRPRSLPAVAARQAPQAIAGPGGSAAWLCRLAASMPLTRPGSQHRKPWAPWQGTEARRQRARAQLRQDVTSLLRQPHFRAVLLASHRHGPRCIGLAALPVARRPSDAGLVAFRPVSLELGAAAACSGVHASAGRRRRCPGAVRRPGLRRCLHAQRQARLPAAHAAQRSARSPRTDHGGLPGWPHQSGDRAG